MVYGFKENKCKKEVYAKEDFSVIEGEIDASLSSKEQIYSYPNGFAHSNTVVISAITESNQTDSPFYYGSNDNVSINVELHNNSIIVKFAFTNTATRTDKVKYRVILLKTKEYYELGDVNMDGSITQEDYDLLFKHIAGEIILPEDNLKLADINQDGKVTTDDLRELSNLINGT